MNSARKPHSISELARVRSLLDASLASHGAAAAALGQITPRLGEASLDPLILARHPKTLEQFLNQKSALSDFRTRLNEGSPGVLDQLLDYLERHPGGVIVPKRD